LVVWVRTLLKPRDGYHSPAQNERSTVVLEVIPGRKEKKRRKGKKVGHGSSRRRIYNEGLCGVPQASAFSAGG
jgi:hypothetical protein